MCAITGWAGSIDYRLLKLICTGTEFGGTHAAGYAYVTSTSKSGCRFFKKAGSPGESGMKVLLKHKDRIKLASRAKLGFVHARFGTHGSNTDANAHPFVSDGVVFCHNGIIRNYHELMPTATVDSECLGPLINKRRVDMATGSCGLVWIENSKLYCYRRNQSLSVVTGISPVDGEPISFVASRPSMSAEFIFEGSRFVKTTLDEGVAYELTPTGPVRVWDDIMYRDPNSEKSAVHRGWSCALAD